MSASQLDLIKDFLLENYPSICEDNKDSSISDLAKILINRQTNELFKLDKYVRMLEDKIERLK